MSTTRTLRAPAALILATALLAAAAPVCATPPVRDATYALNMFSDVTGVNVYTQYVDYSIKSGRDLSASLQWVHDKVVIPAIEGAPGTPDAIDAITSASRPIANFEDAFEDFVKTRNSIQGGLGYRGANASYYVSSEEDYLARMVATGYNRQFRDDNLNLAVGTSYSWDEITPVDVGAGTAPAFRNTLHWNLVATQILTPTSLVRVGVEFNNVHGQQHDPYRGVYVNGTPVPERHPDRRSRRNVFLKLSKYLGAESSLKADFRYYEDDWQVASQTYGLKLSQRVSRQLTVRYRYRYYTQGAAWFYRDDYRTTSSIDGYQTGDYRLGDFGSHLFGGHVAWTPVGLLGGAGFLKNTEFDLSYERYFNSNNFTANIIETSVSVSF